jgi:hypothetical protein
MTEEQAINKLKNLQPITHLIHGYFFEDGEIKWECVACQSRDEAARQAKNFIKFELYNCEKDKNQNL